MIRIRQIKLPINHNENDLKEKIITRLKINKNDLINFKINKKSIDARKEINYIYEIDAKINNEEKVLNKNIKDIIKTPDETYKFKTNGTKKLNHNPIIIGSGPAGLFAGYMLAKNGYKPIIIERGENIDSRVKSVNTFWKKGILNKNSNVQFGEGGAGTFSDGKLNTTIKDKEHRGKEILNIFVKNGAPEEILYINKPHIGTDLLRGVIKNIRNEIIKHGGKIEYNSLLNDIEIKNKTITSIKVNNKTIKTDVLVLAIGHSARDTFEMLLEKNINIKPKPFAIGIRIQHPQTLINKNQYGKEHTNLPNADYKLTYKAKNGRGVYSFCMCPGGFVVNSSSEEGMLSINGMSNHKRDEENANSAIIVTITPDDFGYNPLDGAKFQRKLEKATYNEGKGKIPTQLFKDFIDNKISNKLGNIAPIFKGNYTFANLNNIFPKYINTSLKEAILHFDKKINGFASDDAILSAVESRTSSPIKIIRDDNLISNIKGIYPCGEGAGYAGGIMSAAMDGIKVAEAIAKIYKPFE
ncbi:MAG: FAD-dependent oxidoreductase [Bacilli bacterium]|nr:FAD-dependent oxidoreductase [Bacilli bacterium]